VRRPLPEHLRVPWSLTHALVVVAVAVGFQAALGAVLAQLGKFVKPVAVFLSMVYSGQAQASFILYSFDVVVGFCIVSLYLAHINSSWNAVGWRRVNPARAILYVVGAVLAVKYATPLVFDLVKLIIPGFNSNQAQPTYFAGSTAIDRWLEFIDLVLLPPIFEETLFRGFLFPAFAKRWGVGWGAVISSAIFGFYHAQLAPGISAFVFGLVLCFLYVRLKSVFPGMALHMLNNLLVFLVVVGVK